MLDSGKKRTYGDAKVVTIVGQGTTVVGELKSKGTVRIEGVFSGRLHSDDTVVVQETGRVKADIVAGQIVISGEVEGNVFAHDRLEITANGKLVGDIVAPRVSIAEGVMFEGKCTMKPPGQAAGGSKPAAAPAATPAQPAQAQAELPGDEDDEELLG
jgi:cytoskeletal protein CcmA (bactofilin family)